jgi:hypothetical protein
MRFFSPVPVIRNVAVVGLPKGGKPAPTRPQSGPRWRIRRAGMATPMGRRRVPSAKQKVQFPVTTGPANRSSDFGRRKMRQAIVLDRQSGKK